ncbi:MAG: CHAP domain-containing protein [Ruminococcaceae bacterium]|nr:CHAP domain-containing protein [Oscillospiraceae bacterium]
MKNNFKKLLAAILVITMVLPGITVFADDTTYSCMETKYISVVTGNGILLSPSLTFKCDAAKEFGSDGISNYAPIMQLTIYNNDTKETTYARITGTGASISSTLKLEDNSSYIVTVSYIYDESINKNAFKVGGGDGWADGDWWISSTNNINSYTVSSTKPSIETSGGTGDNQEDEEDTQQESKPSYYATWKDLPLNKTDTYYKYYFDPSVNPYFPYNAPYSPNYPSEYKKDSEGEYVYGNCTWYCWARASEMLVRNGKNPLTKSQLISNPSGWFNCAGGLSYDKKTSAVPKTNSIAVYQGHVRYIEYADSNYLIYSESGYRDTNDYDYDMKTTDPFNGGKPTWLCYGVGTATKNSSGKWVSTGNWSSIYGFEVGSGSGDSKLLGYIYLNVDSINDENAPTINTNLVSNSSKSSYTTDENVTITWNTYTGASSYGLTISRKTGSSWTSRETVYDKNGLTGNSVNIGKLPVGEYRFNMGAYSSGGSLLGDYSELKYFTVVGTSGDESNEDSTDLYPYSSAYKSSKYYTALNNVEMTGEEASDLVNVALSQVGYHEGNSTSELDGSNTSGTNNYSEYGYWFGTQVKGNTTGHFYDWCAMFVSWCARHAGISTSTISNSAYAGASNEIYHFSNLSYFSRGNGTPKKGDLIFFDNPNVDGQWDHVGIVESVTSTQVNTIEGNANEQVKRKTYNLTDTYIQGYGRPNYKNSSVEDSTQWGDWSDWSTTKPTASDTVQVESKTQYGYYHYILQYSNGNCGAYPIDATTFNKIFPSYPTTQKDYHTKYFDSQLSKIDTLTYNGTTYNCYANTCCPDSYNYDNGSNASYFYNLGTRTVYRSRTKLSETISVNSVTLNKNSVTLEVGATESLTATVKPSNATNKAVTWTSSNTSVASVSNGVITAKAAGTATITVKTADGNKTATCTVTVKTPTVAVTGVSLNKTATTLTVGGTETLIATVAPSNATNKAITWTSSNPSVASVSNGVITAKAAGTTTITATTIDGNKTATCVVTVNAIDEDMPSLKIDDVTVAPGEDFYVDIVAENCDMVKAITVNDIEYSESLTLTNAEWLLSGSTLSSVDINGDSLIAFQNAVDANKAVMRLYFTADSEETDGDAYIRYKAMGTDASNKNFDFVEYEGKVTIRSFIIGDCDGDEEITVDDAIYLAFYTFYPSRYPLPTGMNVDFDKDGAITVDDAIHLAFHTFYPDRYPLN